MKAGGIDVSAAQGPHVDWPAVAAAGKRFAFVRALEGKDPDPTHEANRRGALAAGLLVGSYAYLRARHPGAWQADLLLDQLGPLGPGELPPAVDVETLDGQGVEAAQACLLAWVARVRERLGRAPLIYAGPWFWSTQLRGEGLSQLADCPLWLAAYAAHEPPAPRPWTRRLIWQFQGTGGRCPGVAGDVDLNEADLDELEALAVPRPIDPGPVLELVDQTLATSIADELVQARR